MRGLTSSLIFSLGLSPLLLREEITGVVSICVLACDTIHGCQHDNLCLGALALTTTTPKSAYRHSIDAFARQYVHVMYLAILRLAILSSFTLALPLTSCHSIAATTVILAVIINITVNS